MRRNGIAADPRVGANRRTRRRPPSSMAMASSRRSLPPSFPASSVSCSFRCWCGCFQPSCIGNVRPSDLCGPSAAIRGSTISVLAILLRQRYRLENRRVADVPRDVPRDGPFRCGWGSRWKVDVERVMGIEPTLSAWEAEVLPLNYTRVGRHSSTGRCHASRVSAPRRAAAISVEGASSRAMSAPGQGTWPGLE